MGQITSETFDSAYDSVIGQQPFSNTMIPRLLARLAGKILHPAVEKNLRLSFSERITKEKILECLEKIKRAETITPKAPVSQANRKHVSSPKLSRAIYIIKTINTDHLSSGRIRAAFQEQTGYRILFLKPFGDILYLVCPAEADKIESLIVGSISLELQMVVGKELFNFIGNYWERFSLRPRQI